MKILVDADACPVKDIIEEIAGNYKLRVIMVSNSSHVINSDYSEHLVVDEGSQAADIAIANNTEAGDIVVTQDYGLASIILTRGAMAIHPDGKVYTLNNIDGLLMQRYINYKARQARKRIINMKKRTQDDNNRFIDSFNRLIEESVFK
jgi:hypothetical protein